jgi:hypothetical protein
MVGGVAVSGTLRVVLWGAAVAAPMAAS